MYQPPYLQANDCVPFSTLFIYLQAIILLTSLSEDFALCNHTDRCPTTQEFINRPELPTVHFCSLNRCRNARHSSGTTAMDNTDLTVKGLRIFVLFPPLEGRRFSPPFKIACNPKTWGDCPRFRTDIADGNVRLPAARPFCSTVLRPPFLLPPTPRELGAMVWPSLAALQVRSVHCHLGQQQRDDDQARQGDNPTPDH